MDPYLEGSLWTTIHSHLSVEIARQLSPKLRPKYIALPMERFVVALPEGVSIATASVYPDVGASRTGTNAPGAGATAVLAAPQRIATVLPESIPHVTIEIRDVDSRRLVTAVEVLSPYNKRGKGREEYLEKRGKLLQSSAHLIEIDLLRQGLRLPMQEPLPPGHYYVFVGRAQERSVTDVWSIALDQPLPAAIPVPLLPGDPDVVLDLEQAFTVVYDVASYDLAIDYTRPPEVPLEPKEAAWAQELVRQWSL
jgi:hypothetical protein